MSDGKPASTFPDIAFAGESLKHHPSKWNR
jgi:hypothetical protein